MSAPRDPRQVVISALTPGTVLCGRYRIETLIGQGAVSCVYRARDERMERAVALKVLDPLRGPDPVGRARFEREFEILRGLDHDGIARCLELAREGDLDILVLELIEGETLAARLSRGRLEIEEAVTIAAKMAATVQRCHDKGVLHRDLKPANVILEPERGPVIVDFGVAWVGAAANLTRTGAVIGSPQYMAPEVFASSLSDARADVYSLGAILFEMLAGRHIRMAEGVAELALAHQREAPPSVASLRPGIDPALDSIVARAITSDPDGRYATAAELASALETRAPGARGGVRTRTLCKGCRTRLVIDLPHCPGCGAPVSWRLRPGPFAVQLLEVKSVPATFDWLVKRYPDVLRVSTMALRTRLRHAPVPLAVGVDQQSAERLQAEAEEVGCRAEMVRARALFGPRLKASTATASEMLVACGLHAAATSSGTLAAKVFQAEMVAASLLPSAVAIVGIGVAALYARRPVLASQRAHTDERAVEVPLDVPARLRRLSTDRARRLAAAAVARAAPVLIGDDEGLPGDATAAVCQHLEAALTAAADLDVHAAVLAKRSRSRLALEIERARAQAEAGDVTAPERLIALEGERQDLVEASIAHDLAARIALERSQAISAVLATRTSTAEA